MKIGYVCVSLFLAFISLVPTARCQGIFMNPSLEKEKEVLKPLSELEKMDTADLMEEWQSISNNFIPSDVRTFDVPPRQIEPFVMHMEVGDKCQGTYFVRIGEDTIDLLIFSPSRNHIFNRRKQQSGVFYFYAEESGEYEFHFQNKQWTNTIRVTFAFSVNHVGDGRVTKQDLNPLEEKMTFRIMDIEMVESEVKVAQQIQEKYYTNTKHAHTKVLWVAIAETIIILGTTVWQVTYIKRLLDNRRLL
jgi:Na+-transporting NADH:ubiquinone oxidoreductase, subunit NqrF